MYCTNDINYCTIVTITSIQYLHSYRELMSALGAEKFQQAYELLDSGEDEDLLVLLNHCLIFTAISKVMYCS